MIRANFRISKKGKHDVSSEIPKNKEEEKKRDLTKSEFENFMVKSGAAGSFMVFRSDKKEDELGLEEL